MLKELQFPIDFNYILRKKKSLKKKLLEKEFLLEKRIAILGGSSTTEIKNILELFLLNSGINPTFYESDYNKYYEDALFGSERLLNFNPDIIYIHTTNINIDNFDKISNISVDLEISIDKIFKKFRSIWEALTEFKT